MNCSIYESIPDLKTIDTNCKVYNDEIVFEPKSKLTNDDNFELKKI